jgi:prepilin-type N-terminal cleavage/methylation domain-containing protein
MRRRESGFTVVELLIAVTVAAIILALAMPSYQDVINKRAVTNSAERAATMLALARSESVKRNLPITVKVDTAGNSFCLGLTSAADCNCFAAAGETNYCEVVDGGASSSVRMGAESLENVELPPVLTSAGTAKTSVRLTFDPVRGILDTANDTAGEILFTSANDRFAVRTDVVLAGRVETCTPAAKKVPGFKACPAQGN